MSKKGEPKSETGGLTLEPPAPADRSDSPMGFAQDLLEETLAASQIISSPAQRTPQIRTPSYPHSVGILAQLLSALFPEETQSASVPTTADAAELSDFDIGPSITRPPASITKPIQEEIETPPQNPNEAAHLLTQQANELVEVVLVGTDSDSNKEIHLVFKEDIFAGMHLRLITTPIGLEAVFMVQDKNARRMIEGRADDMMARLSKRGLRIASHRIEDISSP